MKVKGIRNKVIKKHNKNLADVAMSEFLEMLKYKGGWYNRNIVELGRYEASTTVCSDCGYKIEKLDTKVREWYCPKCNSYHDRDINAAIVIKQKAEEKLLNKNKNMV